MCAAQAGLEQDLRSAKEAVNKAEQLAGLPLTKFDSPGMRSSRFVLTRLFKKTSCMSEKGFLRGFAVFFVAPAARVVYVQSCVIKGILAGQ